MFNWEYDYYKELNDRFYKRHSYFIMKCCYREWRLEKSFELTEVWSEGLVLTQTVEILVVISLGIFGDASSKLMYELFTQ